MPLKGHDVANASLYIYSLWLKDMDVDVTAKKKRDTYTVSLSMKPYYIANDKEAFQTARAELPKDFSIKEKMKDIIKHNFLDTVGSLDFKYPLASYWTRRRIIPYTGDLTLTLSSPLAIGMGNSLPLDIPGITLHRNYGFPYIPGSAVRGMVRYVVSMVKKYRVSGKDKETFSMVERLLFGNYYENELKPSKTRGVVHFLSVVPEKDQEDYRLLEPDIINNHHQKYYTGDSPPVDTDNPNPVNFIRVKAGTKMHFAWQVEPEGEVRSRWDYLCQQEKVQLDINEAVVTFFDTIAGAYDVDSVDDEGFYKDINRGIEILIKITGSLYGFGAKTRVGYGRMKESKKS